MSTDTIYRLVSSILSIAGSYDSVTFDRAIEHVKKNFQGQNRESLIKIITALKELLGRSPDSMLDQGIAPNSSEHYPHTVGKHEQHQGGEPPGPGAEPKVRELKAILRDQDFLPTKADTVEFIRKHFGSRVTIKPEHKESRDALIDKAISAFRRASPKEQRPIYQIIRKAYLQSRRSSLTDWSEIISGNRGEP